MRDKIRKYSKVSVIVVTFLIILTYAYFEAGGIMKGPTVVIDYPKNGITVNQDSVVVSGTANNVSFMQLNGRPIYTDSDGNFSEKIILSEGYNSLFIRAEDRMGKEKEEIIEVIMSKRIASTTEESLAKK